MDVQLLQRVSARFGEVLAQVGPGRYGLPTPCPGWTVVDLVDHVLSGNHRTAMLLTGLDRTTVAAELERLPRADDRRVDFPRSLAAQERAVWSAAPGLVVPTAAGAMPASSLLVMRSVDLLVHSWDLARAVGADDKLPPDLVAEVLALVEPRAAWVAVSGVFGDGAEGAPPPADDQERLLQLTGRRPR
jgi:uncharacterized protein (TIGR03086 family)